MNVICKKCGIPKPEDSEHFRPHGHAKGLRGTCRECEAVLRKEHYRKDPEKYAAISRKWSKDNPEKRNATKKKWRQNNLKNHKAIARKSVYGITDFQFQQKLELQGGGCAICGFIFPETSGGDRKLAPHVDHNHTTGKVRGILCHNCNKGLGHFKDRYELLEAASFYLKILG